MKSPNVELVAESGPGQLDQILDFQLADLVCEGLTWPGGVPIYFCLDVFSGQRRVLKHYLDGVITGPAVLVNSSVDHQS